MNPEVDDDDDRSLTEIIIDPASERLYLIENNLVSPSLKETIALNRNVDYDYSLDSLANNNAANKNNFNFVTAEKVRRASESNFLYSFKTSTSSLAFKNVNDAEIAAPISKSRNKMNDNYASHQKHSGTFLPNEIESSQNLCLKSKNDQEPSITKSDNLDCIKFPSTKQHKPMKALSQIGSKSMSELNFIEEEKSYLNSGENSQSVENLIFNTVGTDTHRTLASAFSENRMHEKKINDKRNLRKYSSTFNLIREEASQNFDSKSLDKTLNKKRSHSLTNLSSFPKPNYSHIQSKVKQYIQERKRHETEERAKSQSKSLPVTPLKQKIEKNVQEEILLLDEKVLSSLSSSNVDYKKFIPEELKKIGHIMHDENARLKILSALFLQLKEERQSRADLGSTLNALQLDYDNLLVQFAEAKNTIDDLRLYKNDSVKNEDSSLRTCNRHSLDFKKALSTSNLFSECSSSNAHTNVDPIRLPSNLVKATSSPLVDPNISLTVKLIRDNNEKRPTSVTPNLSSNNEDQLSIKSSLFSSENCCSAWMEAYEYVYQKLKEYIILESNSALKGEERNIIWNFIIQKYSELCQGYESLKADAIEKHECKKKLEEIEASIEALASKLSVSGIKQNQHSHKKGEDFATSGSLNFSTIQIDTSNQYVDQSYSKQSTSRGILNEKEASTLKQVQPREVDSGYPASDRSTRNSQFPSFDQSESLVNGVCESEFNFGFTKSSYGKRDTSTNHNSVLYSKRHSLPSPTLLSGMRENAGWGSSIQHSYRQNKYRSGIEISKNFSTILDEEYDASGSSELDDSCEEDKMRRLSKRRYPKGRRSANSSPFLDKYEDKFVCSHRFKSNQLYESPSNSLSTGTKKILDLSQIEKNSKYFEIQVSDLKSKGLARGKMNKQMSKVLHSSGHTTPLKAMNKKLENEPLDTSSPSSFSGSFLESSRSNNTPATSTPKSKEAFVFPVDCQRCYVPCRETKRHISPLLQSKDVQKMKRSYSIPSLHNSENACATPFIHIDYFDCCQQKHPRNSLPSSSRFSQNKMQHPTYASRENRSAQEVYNADKNSSLLDSLEKATSIAEAMRRSSRRVLGFLRADYYPSSKQ